ncbi:spherulin-1A [Phyllosticta citricarpa]
MHLPTTLPLWLTLSSTLIHAVCAIDKTADAQLVASAKLAATRLDRAALFADAPNSTVFDFTTHPYHTFAPGGVVNANAATFPYVTGNGLSLAMLYLGPCAMLPAHLHPRAANYVVSVKGTTETYMVEENGAATVKTTLREGMMTIFPTGSVHMMENPGCTPNTLVSALNAEDSGTLNLATTLFGAFPSALIFPNVGYAIDNDTLVDIGRDMPGVGTGAIWGRRECLARCGVSRVNGTGTGTGTGTGGY